MDEKIKEITSKTIVTQEKCADAVGSGELQVYATPMMVALMENAAAKVASNYIPEGCTTVGTAINIKHIAASPLNAEITAKATLIETDGRRFLFNVEAYDNTGKIGEGTHERFSVKIEKFMEKAEKRLG